MSGLIEYPNALEACFDFAGREMVERWQDEHDEDAAERLAREWLLEAQASTLVKSVTFGGHEFGNRQVTIRGF